MHIYIIDIHTIVNLFLFIMEEKWVNLHRPLIYNRFIDDLILISKYFDKDEFLEVFDGLELTIESRDRVNFLDLYISIDTITNKLKFSLYTKPTNTFQYLPYDSNHPSFIHKNIPKALFLRQRRINTDYSDYLYSSNTLIKQLMTRGYRYEDLSVLRYNIGYIDRDCLIEYKCKEKCSFINEKSFFIKMDFDINYIKLKQDLLNTFNYIKNKFNWMEDYNLKVVNKLQPNLNLLLVKNFKFYNYGEKRTNCCNKRNCKICN